MHYALWCKLSIRNWTCYVWYIIRIYKTNNGRSTKKLVWHFTLDKNKLSVSRKYLLNSTLFTIRPRRKSTYQFARITYWNDPKSACLFLERKTTVWEEKKTKTSYKKPAVWINLLGLLWSSPMWCVTHS